MMRTLKLLFFSLLIISTSAFAEKPPASKVTGFFVAFGVGPRMPLGDFANTTDIGYGVNVEFTYTDNEILPVFLFANLGYEQYPGSQNYFRETDYSNFHTNSLPINIGARYYFAPLLENIVLLMPIVQVSANYTYYQKLHEFDQNLGRNNFLEDGGKFGFSAGAGVSMFMMELLASYNYLPKNQFIAVDLKVRIPLYINF
ncbi:MAG TPA: outer membrane beta-barrel protein [Ignavibacteriaceae bacterium]